MRTYYINLESSIKRNNQMLKQFELIPHLNYKKIQACNINNYNDFIITPFKKPIKKQKYDFAILASHLKAIKTAYDNKLNQVLILEDDIDLNILRHTFDEFKKITSENINSIDIIQLHISNWKKYNFSDKLFLKKRYNSRYDWSCCAYIINKSGMKKIIDKYYNYNINKFEIKIKKGLVSDELIYNSVNTLKTSLPFVNINNPLIYPSTHFCEEHELIFHMPGYLKIKNNEINIINNINTNCKNISKFIHITWRNSELNENQSYIYNKWKKLHPNYIVKLWTDKNNKEFINTYYPEYVNDFNRFPKIIQKIDLIRLLYLYHYGGIYTDIDVLPFKNFTPLLNCGKKIILGTEHNQHAKTHKLNKIISNSVMIAEKKHPFILKLIQVLIENSYLNIKKINDILNTTGPFVVNRVYDNYFDKSDILLLDFKYFNPLSVDELDNNKYNNYIKYSFAAHLFVGSWWRKENKLSMNKINNIEKHVLDKLNEKISCVCITKNNINYVKRIIKCFNQQIYNNKELIIIYEDNNLFINELKNLKSNNIKLYQVSTSPKQTLGYLRNLSYEKSTGKYLCQWDDDDYYSCLRLYEQYINLDLNNSNCCTLSDIILYDSIKNRFYLCTANWSEYKTIGFDGSIMFKKETFLIKYKNIEKGEDTSFIYDNKQNNSFTILKNNPKLYYYIVHNENTFNYKHMTDIIKYRSKLTNNISIKNNLFKNDILTSLSNGYGEIIKSSNLKKKYKTGIVITSFGRLNCINVMLESLKRSELPNDILFIIIDETNSKNHPTPNYLNLETSEFIKKYNLEGIDNIKIFKNYHSGVGNSIKTAFEIMLFNFNCEYFMILDCDVYIKKYWYTILFNSYMKIQDKDNLIVSGFNRFETFGIKAPKRIIDSYNKDFNRSNRIGGINWLFNRTTYYTIQSFIDKQYFDDIICDFFNKQKYILLTIKQSILQHIGKFGLHNDFDISNTFYENIEDVIKLYKNDIIPPIIHRLMLYDSEFPKNVLPYMKNVRQKSIEFHHILWKNNDIIKLLTEKQLKIYNKLINIQKSDYARYIILSKFGGIYLDYDIILNEDLFNFYNHYKNNNSVLFTETLIKKNFIENTKKFPIRKGIPEKKIRVANYAIMSKSNTKYINDVLNLCNLRSMENEIKVDYDIIYTTGPDVTSSINRNNNDKLLSLNESNKILEHKHVGHWRKNHLAFVQIE